MTTQQQAIETYLQMLLTCILLQEQSDILKTTSAYRHDLKQAAKRMDRELDSLINSDGGLIWGVDDNAFYHQLDYLKELIKELAPLRADENGIIAKIIHMYKKQPDAVLEALNIKLIESNIA